MMHFNHVNSVAACNTFDSGDNVDSKSHTSCLISRIEENRNSTFILPPVVYIDLREYDFVIDRVRKFFCQKSAVERFFAMNGYSVKKINLILGQYNRLNVLQNTTITSLDALMVDGCGTWSLEDSIHLCATLNEMKPRLLCVRNSNWTFMDKATIAVIVQHLDTFILEKCCLKNQHVLSILRKEQNITLKSLQMCNCGIEIDREIAEAISRLPDDIQLDLSRNKLTKMDPTLLPEVLICMPKNKRINMTRWRIAIDVDIVKALSKMPELKSLKASFNKLIPKAAQEFSMSQLQQLYLSDCGIIDTVCVSLMISLSKNCPLLEILNLSGNNLTSDKWCPHVQMKQLRKLNLSICGLSDTVCMSLMISLSKHCPLLEVLDLSVNNLSSSGLWKMVYLIKRMKNLSKLILYSNPCSCDEKCKEKVEEALQKSDQLLIIWTGFKYRE